MRVQKIDEYTVTNPARKDSLTSEFARPSLAIVLRQVGRIATIGALCCAIGLHWVALQSVAWATMILDYSKRAPLCQAITQTFDGAHPCSLCHVVSKAKNSEKNRDFQSPAPKIDMICAPLANCIVRLFVPFQYAADHSLSFEFGHSPPVPPPRSLLS
jgi:hypothetical protein